MEDIIVNLYRAKSKVAEKHDLSLIKMRNKGGDEIWFLTNLFEMPAYEVTELHRWDIEIFFKFIKQDLGYKHFLSHAVNGMKVYIYMIIITALLFLVYKIRNNLHGFKIALLQFTLDLNDSFIRSIVYALSSQCVTLGSSINIIFMIWGLSFEYSNHSYIADWIPVSRARMTPLAVQIAFKYNVRTVVYVALESRKKKYGSKCQATWVIPMFVGMKGKANR